MQVAVSISEKIYPIKKNLEIDGWLVPWEVVNYHEDYEISKSLGGIFDLSAWTCIQISGPDANDYLQRMSTVDFKKRAVGDVCYGAFLTGKGTVVSLGIFQILEKSFEYWIPESQKANTLIHLEKFHFAEKLQFTDQFSHSALIGLWNPTRAVRDEFQLGPQFPTGKSEWRRWRSIDCEVWRDTARKDLYFIRVKRAGMGHFIEHLKEISLPLLGQKVFEYFRVEAAVPALGPEANEQVIILETGFEEAVARNKGCYPGQEVVERIYTYGQVNKKLLRVTLTGEVPALPCALMRDGKEVGKLVTAIASPAVKDSSVGLAFLHKDHWSDLAFTF